SPQPPSIRHALAGANIIINLSAGNEITGKAEYRRDLVAGQSGRLICGYIYACAGDGESTTDVVFSGHNIIAENGKVLAESELFKNGIIYADMDLMSIASHRRKNTSFRNSENADYIVPEFDLQSRENSDLRRFIDPHPFVPSNESDRERRCKTIMDIQAQGLKKRIEHVKAKHIVLGISGGLDSTLALLISARAFEMLGRDVRDIYTVTMPCFGTTIRTYDNAIKLCQGVGSTFMEVNIKGSVLQHFKDIGHGKYVHDLTFENAQARERTQVLMDIAGRYDGFVVGTGDLSELALGWATYNGDHMSMYGVNASIPKTLIKYLVKYVADYSSSEILKEALYDILDTPVSPELLPPDKDGNIIQKTEETVGPYELHDFFLYNMMRMSFPADKTLYLAKQAFGDKYEDDVLKKWLKNFYWRFFNQQFKRSCLPDGPKVGSVSLSPRGDWRMPSDAVPVDWLKNID
ncbi:MAG: NAD(+) synthase, partial [Firmicutes bacterium]|nr:NAD(+) synthase [Bacillota bacterium]